MSYKAAIAHELEEGVQIVLMRAPGDAVYLSINLEATDKKFDPTRMPIIWCDSAVYDIGIIKSLHDLSSIVEERLAEFDFTDKAVTISATDNFRLIDKLTSCDKAEFRIYYSNYKIDHFDLSSIALRGLQQSIRRELLA